MWAHQHARCLVCASPLLPPDHIHLPGGFSGCWAWVFLGGSGRGAFDLPSVILPREGNVPIPCCQGLSCQACGWRPRPQGFLRQSCPLPPGPQARGQ